MIRTRLPPDEAPSPAPKSGSKRSSKRQFDLGDYPPGFDTGDAALNKAASVLRLCECRAPHACMAKRVGG